MIYYVDGEPCSGKTSPETSLWIYFHASMLAQFCLTELTMGSSFTRQHPYVPPAGQSMKSEGPRFFDQIPCLVSCCSPTLFCFISLLVRYVDAHTVRCTAEPLGRFEADTSIKLPRA